MANTYTLISSNVLTGSAASVTFSSIPSTYTDLVVRFTASSDTAAASTLLGIQFNGDTATNYSYVQLTGNGSTATSSVAGTFGTGYAGQIDASTSTASTFGSGEVYIPSYTVAQSKPISGFGAAETNATASIMRAIASLWRSNSSITSIVLTPAAGNLVSGSSFYLYGIKNA